MSKWISLGPLFEKKGGDATCHPSPIPAIHQDGSKAALKVQPSSAAKDVCRNRSRGNTESAGAFEAIKDRLTRNQNAVLRVIKERGEHGATTDEIADYFGVGQNVVSGRVSELHFRLHKIEKIGTRPTRNGHPAAVWKAV